MTLTEAIEDLRQYLQMPMDGYNHCSICQAKWGRHEDDCALVALFAVWDTRDHRVEKVAVSE